MATPCCHATSSQTNNKYYNKLFGDQATSALVRFHVDHLSWSNWNLEILVFVEGKKPENPKKNPWSKARTNNNNNNNNDNLYFVPRNKPNPHMTPGWNRTQAILVGGK